MAGKVNHLAAIGIEDTIVRRQHVEDSRLPRRDEPAVAIRGVELALHGGIVGALRAARFDEEPRRQNCRGTLGIEAFRLDGVATLTRYETGEAVARIAHFPIAVAADHIHRRVL